ncbi:hypothetical protein LOAG_02089 [Loa loa]|uniref:Uncharacterized protein n=1 Tax=Loa loa TaxID=7209 RepID=A0A1S0U7H2_LOALO|nr:hypothetical protein LOAG_02089 [Loa loa]EFO26397.1 hypothetical protein LOAG_02089 [Loa loa]
MKKVAVYLNYLQRQCDIAFTHSKDKAAFRQEKMNYTVTAGAIFGRIRSRATATKRYPFWQQDYTSLQKGIFKDKKNYFEKTNELIRSQHFCSITINDFSTVRGIVDIDDRNLSICIIFCPTVVHANPTLWM